MDDLNIITLKSVFYHLCANQYFKKDIENIFIGHTVKDKDKNNTAIEFYNKGTLEKAKEKILSLTKHTIFK